MTQFESGKPIETPIQTVLPEWVDYNGHFNMAYYNVMFDRALDILFERLGIAADYVKTRNASSFTAEIHVTYIQELVEGDPVRISMQLLDWDAKRMHVFEHMYHAEKGYLAATSEQMAIHVSLETRRAAPFPPEIQTLLDSMMKAHRSIARPAQAGHVIGIPRKKAS